MSNAAPTVPFITETMIEGTKYIVESVPAEKAETIMFEKIKKLILNNVQMPEKPRKCG